MITILHGQNTIQSRQKLVELLDKARTEQKEVVRLDAKSLSQPVLELKLGSSDLFGQEKIIVVEELHSLPTSARKKILLEMVAASTTNIILWEKRSLTASMLKKFPSAHTSEFKTSNSLFKWLESLGSGQDAKTKLQLLRNSLNSDGDYFCFLMLVRQIRQLIQVKSGGRVAGAPFMQAKLAQQASIFSLAALKQLYSDLLDLDYRQKTSKLVLSLSQELDLLTMKL